MTVVRRIGRAAAYAGLALLGLIVLLAAAVLFVGGTETGREWLAATISEQISVPGETRVGISRLEGPLPGTIVVEGLTVEDRDGVWLTLDRAAMEWNPWRLLSGEFSVDLLEADGVTVIRPPAPGEEDDAPAEPFRWPSLPVEVSIEKFVAGPIELREPVLGAPATLRAEGEARVADSGRAAARLTVVRTDGPESRVSLDASYDPRTDVLAVDARAEEPEGGLIGRAAGFEPPPPVQVTFAGEGPVTDWLGRLNGSMGDEAEVSAEFRIRRIDGELALGIDSTLQAPGLIPPTIGPLARDGVQLVFDGRTTGPDTVRIETLSVTTSALAANVTADLDLATESVEGSAEVVVTDGAALGGLTEPADVTGARLNAGFAGAIRQPHVELTARADSVGLPEATLRDLTLDLLLELRRPIDRGPLQAVFETRGRVAAIEAASLPPGELAAPLTFGASGEVDLAAGTAALSSFEMATPAMTASAAGEADLNTLASHGTARLVAEDLAFLSPLAGRPVHGAAELSADFRIAEELKSVEADLNGELRGVTADGLPLAAIFGDLTTIDGNVATDDQGTRSGRLEVRAKAGSLTASATVPPDGSTVDGSYRLLVPDLAPVADALGSEAGGDLALTGNVGGNLGDPDVTASLVVESARAAGQPLGTVRGEIQAESVVTAPSGRLEVSASPRPGPVRLATSFALRDEALRLDPLRISAAGSSIEGSLAAPVTGAPITGRLSGDLDRLGPVLALGGLDGSGSGSLDLQLGAEGGNQAVTATLGLRDLELAPAGDGGATRIARADADARIVVADTPRGRVSLEARGIAAGGAEVESLSLDGSGDLDGADVRLDARGESPMPFTVSTTGTVSTAAGGVALDLSRLTATVDRERIALASPATLSWRPGETRISNLDLRIASGRITADADLRPDRFSGTAEIRQMPLSLARLFLPGEDVRGTVSGRATASGSARNPAASANLRFSDVRASAAENVPPVEGTLDAEWRGAELTVGLAVSGFADRPLQANLTAPLRLNPETMTPDMPADGNVSGSIRWQGEVGPLFLLTPLDDQRLSGMAEIALGIDGTVSSPRLTGFVALDNGSYEHLAAGTLLRNLELRIDAEGRRLVLSRLSATDGGSGKLNGSGALTLDEARPDTEFTITADDFIVVRRDDVTASTDADLRFARTPDGASLSGSVDVEEAEIRLVNQLPPTVVSLEVEERNGAGGQSIASAEAEEALEAPDAGPSLLELDLRVSLPERIFVRGRGLDSEWSGQFRITGTADAPQIGGEMSSVRGRISLLNTNFELAPSTIRVSQGNAGEMILNLDIRATAETGDLTAVVEVTGTADNPSIRLTSTPELPQDEVLARLLFGRSTAQLGAIEAVQLAAAVAELTGSGGPGLLDMGRKFMGVDVLRVGGGGEGEAGATVQAGKYIADDVFVGVEQGTGAQSGAATVEIELLPNVSVQSKVGQSGDTNVGVKVQWDY